MLRAIKDSNGIIVGIGNDEGQSGNYIAEGQTIGVWCDFTFEMPELPLIEGAEEHCLRLKENETHDGVELRLDQDVLDFPRG